MRNTIAPSILTVCLLAIPASAQSHDTIRAAQQALKDKDVDPGPIDGIYGPQTRAAIKKYQGQQNVDADGRLGPKTLDALGVRPASPKTSFKASGENVKNSYASGGKTIRQGSKDMVDQMKDGMWVQAPKTSARVWVKA